MVCGQHYAADESAEFLKDVNVDLASKGEHSMKEVVWTLRKMPNHFNRFALMCNLNVGWPQWSTPYMVKS